MAFPDIEKTIKILKSQNIFVKVEEATLVQPGGTSTPRNEVAISSVQITYRIFT